MHVDIHKDTALKRSIIFRQPSALRMYLGRVHAFLRNSLGGMAQNIFASIIVHCSAIICAGMLINASCVDTNVFPVGENFCQS